MSGRFYDPSTYRARDSVGYLLRRLYSTVSAGIEATFQAQGFTLMQWVVLMHLRDGLVRTASDIAREFQHDTGALTRVLDQLECRGLLARQRSSRDRRVVELNLTPEGHRVVAELLPEVVAQLNAALAPLTRSEFEQFRRTLIKVLDRLQPLAPAARPAATMPRRPAVPGARARHSAARGARVAGRKRKDPSR